MKMIQKSHNKIEYHKHGIMDKLSLCDAQEISEPVSSTLANKDQSNEHNTGIPDYLSNIDSSGNISITYLPNYHIQKCNFGKYEIEVVLDKNDKFIDIKSIKISKSFCDIMSPFPSNESAEDIIDKYLAEME